MTKRKGLCLSVLISSMAISSCQHTPPKHELCIVSTDATYLICEDPRQDPKEYERPLSPDDIVTNLDDYEHVRAWVLRKMECDQE